MDHEFGADDDSVFRDPYKAIAAATHAAKEGDAALVVELLVRSGYNNSLIDRLDRRYPGLDRSVCEELVAEGVAVVHKAVVDRRLVSNPAPYLLRVATRHANREVERLRGQVSLDKVDDRDLYRAHDALENPATTEALKKEALRVARSLIAQLGLETVQRVMTLIFDAVELGHVGITNADVAEILDLDVDAVRQARSRGFRRLERLARENGYGDMRALELEDDEEDE